MDDDIVWPKSRAEFEGESCQEGSVGGINRGQEVLIASKFPGGFSFRAEDLPGEREASLARWGVTRLTGTRSTCLPIEFQSQS